VSVMFPLVDHLLFEIHSSRDKRVRQQLSKQRRATMSRGRGKDPGLD